ncbi:MAG: RHS repeat-associated core domain-containing protein [Acidobacteriota bacterium]
MVSTIDLDPFGGETSRSLSSAFQPRKYTTYERDSNGGDDAMHRRFDATASRFSQPDPYDGSCSLINPQSFNRYAYVGNDPVNFTDPSGLDWQDDLGEPPPLPGAPSGTVNIPISFDDPINWDNLPGAGLNKLTMLRRNSASNGCLEFVNIVQTFLDAAQSEREFFDMLARTFTTAANSNLQEWRDNAGGLVLSRDSSRKVLSDNGILSTLRIPGVETFSYVRHFVGGLVSSGRHGLAGLKFFGDQEDGQTTEDSRVDRAINEVSFDLGISYFGPTTGSLDRARLSLAANIRKRFCE